MMIIMVGNRLRLVLVVGDEWKLYIGYLLLRCVLELPLITTINLCRWLTLLVTYRDNTLKHRSTATAGRPSDLCKPLPPDR